MDIPQELIERFESFAQDPITKDSAVNVLTHIKAYQRNELTEEQFDNNLIALRAITSNISPVRPLITELINLKLS
jgi:hypothetical protein